MFKLNKKTIIILISILTLTAIASGVYFVRLRVKHNEANPAQNIQSYSDLEEDRGGQILNLDSKQITIRESDGNILNIILNQDILFYDYRIKPEKIIPFSSFKIGDWIGVHGIARYNDSMTEILFTPKRIGKWFAPGQLPPDWNY